MGASCRCQLGWRSRRSRPRRMLRRRRSSRAGSSTRSSQRPAGRGTTPDAGSRTRRTRAPGSSRRLASRGPGSTRTTRRRCCGGCGFVRVRLREIPRGVDGDAVLPAGARPPVDLSKRPWRMKTSRSATGRRWPRSRGCVAPEIPAGGLGLGATDPPSGSRFEEDLRVLPSSSRLRRMCPARTGSASSAS